MNKTAAPTSHSIYKYDSLTGFWGAENIKKEIRFTEGSDIVATVSHNQYGNRDKKVDVNSSEKKFLCYGGSHTWGAYVEQDERYTDVLSKLTNHHFLNIGHASFGFDQIALAIEQRSDMYKPEGILIEQYPWAFHRVLNSYVNGYLKPYFYLRQDGELQYVPLPSLARFKMYRNIVGEYRSYKKEFQEMRGNVSIKEGYDPTLDPVFILWKSSYYEYAYELFGKIAERVKNYCDQKGIKLLIFLTAHSQHFIPQSASELVDYDLPSKKLMAVLDKYSVPYINLAKDLVAEQAHGRTVIFPDGHLNQHGHIKVAERLVPELKKRGWF
jgi:lysophospholipase L1-like esterase